MAPEEGNRDPEEHTTPGHVFGPVRSRRLGQSLGIDPIPLKTCNWNCVYCQLGRTRPLRNDRREYTSTQAILQETEVALSGQPPGTVDWVTLVGSGETLLHSNLESILKGIRAMTHLPMAVITNGSLLSDPRIRRELFLADAVLPSLDAGTPELFRRINRPHPRLTFHRHLAGLEAFGREYEGKLFLEVMMVRGANDTVEALSDLARAMERIRLDGIHLSSPERPPAEPWVAPTDQEGFMRASALLGESAEVLHPSEDVLSLPDPATALARILDVLPRHPLSTSQLERATAHWPTEARQRLLEELARSASVKKTTRLGRQFWTARKAEFPLAPGEEDSSRNEGDPNHS